MYSKAIVVSLLVLATQPAGATEIVYTPVNPSFGGSPLNGPVLMNSANAQNKHTDPALESALSRLSNQTPLDQFNARLQSLVLDRIAQSITGSLFDSQNHLQPGQVETSAFIITIVDIGNNMLLITTTDKSTGATTSFQVSATP